MVLSNANAMSSAGFVGSADRRGFRPQRWRVQVAVSRGEPSGRKASQMRPVLSCGSDGPSSSKPPRRSRGGSGPRDPRDPIPPAGRRRKGPLLRPTKAARGGGRSDGRAGGRRDRCWVGSGRLPVRFSADGGSLRGRRDGGAPWRVVPEGGPPPALRRASASWGGSLRPFSVCLRDTHRWRSSSAGGDKKFVREASATNPLGHEAFAFKKKKNRREVFRAWANCELFSPAKRRNPARTHVEKTRP